MTGLGYSRSAWQHDPITVQYGSRTIGFDNGSETLWILLSINSNNEIVYTAKSILRDKDGTEKERGTKEGRLFEKTKDGQMDSNESEILIHGETMCVQWSKVTPNSGLLYYPINCTMKTQAADFLKKK